MAKQFEVYGGYDNDNEQEFYKVVKTVDNDQVTIADFYGVPNPELVLFIRMLEQEGW